MKNAEKKTVLMYAEPSGDYADYQAGRVEVYRPWGELDVLTGLPVRPKAAWEVAV